MQRSSYLNTLIILPVLILATQFLRLGDWIVDDAAITFSYARSLAEGSGLRLQNGAEPVEGYSNPLWVFVLSPFFLLRIFDPVLVPKLLGFLSASLAMFLAFRLKNQIGIRSAMIITIGLCFIALSPSIAIWSACGLENGLFILASFATAIVSASAVTNGHLNVKHCAGAGLLAGACALTRPDGILFIGAMLLTLACGGGHFLKSTPIIVTIKRLLIATSSALALILPYLAFRLIYFGEWLPNTYYAKSGPNTIVVTKILLGSPWLFEKLESLGGAILTGNRGILLFLAHALLMGSSLNYKGQRSALISLWIFSAFAGLSYILLPYDWMPEYRFATAWVFFYIVSSALALSLHLERVSLLWFKSTMAAFVILLATHTMASFRRIGYFSNHPAISLLEVASRGHRFTDCGKLAGIERPSLLTADIGGIAYFTTVRIIDLGMLCDRNIAKQLGEWRQQPDREAFHDYIFGKQRPEFIATRAYHSWLADLDSDTRFRELYVPIFEYKDQWVFDRYHKDIYSGDYVRKDLVDAQILERMRKRSECSAYFGCGKREPY